MQKTKAKLGKPLFLNKHELEYKFPLCPSRVCWCYNCCMSVARTTRYEGYQNYDMADYKVQALELARQNRDTYLLNNAKKETATVKCHLGEAMSYKSEDSLLLRFPLCPSHKCWCHDCSVNRVQSILYYQETYQNPQHDCYWGKEDYEIEGRESAIKLRQNYIDINS